MSVYHESARRLRIRPLRVRLRRTPATQSNKYRLPINHFRGREQPLRSYFPYPGAALPAPGDWTRALAALALIVTWLRLAIISRGR
jgi:hypothetical protein